MTVFPLFENIDNKVFLIVGGGMTAKRKVQKLLTFTSRIIVIAEETDISNVRVLRKKVDLEDLLLGDFVIAATDDRARNREIAEFCKINRIPVNVVDDPELCSFIFPSVIKRGDLSVGISTGGASPLYSSHLRKEIEDLLPDHIGGILERMSALRKAVPSRIKDQKDRAECYGKILTALLASDNAADDTEIEAIISSYENGD
ncbi:MAG: bifunctional precorrin-2 dehydrogenase/sirohydrochlorin ferrochelatase [Lachnospiraceae bacterium]|nr:bifunctional precorrin-2 dehydrogenase/sirohydrochlorin ferrochelatase [Lachnospiraceae bacterium]